MLVGASGHAAAAEDALSIVADQILRGFILLGLRFCTVKVLGVVHAQLIAEGLQLAASAALAGEALAVVHGEQQLQRELAGFLHLRCIGENFHPLVDRINAGRNQRTGALHFYNAHTASANFVDILQEAQCGDVDARIPCSLQNRRILRHREGHAVDFYIDHIH